MGQTPSPAYYAKAEAIAASDYVLGQYAATEYDCLNNDGKTWLAAIVEETERRTGAADMKAALIALLFEIDQEIDQRRNGGNDENWQELQAKSDAGHAALRNAQAFAA